MAKTVDELRNEIRVAVGRYERVESTAFTKEALAAICTALDYEVDTDRYPPKAEMRAGIRWKIDAIETPDAAEGERPLRKSELQAVAAALDGE
jgi:hypothetical protein